MSHSRSFTGATGICFKQQKDSGQYLVNALVVASSEVERTWKVQLWVGGSTFVEVVQAGTRNDAIATAKARNPTAKVIGANPVSR